MEDLFLRVPRKESPTVMKELAAVELALVIAH